MQNYVKLEQIDEEMGRWLEDIWRNFHLLANFVRKGWTPGERWQANRSTQALRDAMNRAHGSITLQTVLKFAALARCSVYEILDSARAAKLVEKRMTSRKGAEDGEGDVA